MARHDYSTRTWADGRLTQRLDALAQAGDWGAEWGASGSAGVRLEPCAPTEVYAHSETRRAVAGDIPVFLTRQGRRHSRSRGVVSLMWAGVIALGALQLAREVERRLSAREPSMSEVAIQARPTRQIHAAWREIGQSEAAQPVIAHVEARAPAAPIDPTRETEGQRGPAGQSDIGASPTAAIDLRAPQKSDSREVVVAGTSSEAREGAQAKAEAASIAPATGSARESKSDEHAANPAAAEVQAQDVAEARLGPTSVQTEDPVEPLAQQRRRGRPSVRSSLALKAAVIVTPGEFVAARYFTVYGLNGRSP